MPVWNGTFQAKPLEGLRKSHSCTIRGCLDRLARRPPHHLNAGNQDIVSLVLL